MLNKYHVCTHIARFMARTLSASHGNRNVCWPKPDYGPMEVMRSELMNGIKVASAKPLGAQIGACTIMFYQGGSRYEQDDQIGASHFLRVMSAGSGCGYTSYIKSRYLQQSGGFISCSSDRQSVAFTLCCPSFRFADLKNYLLDTAARCCYHQWEIEDFKTIVKEDLIRITPEQMLMDTIQKASFSGSLANSVFCPEERIDGISKDSLVSFVDDNFRSVRCAVGSVGMPFEEVLKMAERIDIRREKTDMSCPSMPSYPKGGYEYHDLGAGSDTWIAIAVPGSSTCDLSCLLKHNVIAAACGTGNMQAGQHSLDRTPQPPLGMMAANDLHTNYQAFNVSYFDNGIFGIVAKTRAQTATQAALCAAEFLSNIGDLSFRQIDVGKRRLKTSLAVLDEECIKVSEGLALQIASGLQMDNVKISMDMIDRIPPEEIIGAAKILANKSICCMSMAVVGDIGAVPEGRELLCR